MEIKNEDENNEIENIEEAEQAEKIEEHYNPLFENLGFCSMDIKDGEKIPKTTKGQEKLLNQLYEIIRNELFIAKIVELRKKYQIPEGGYDGYEEHDQVYDEEHDTYINIVVCDDFICPHEWINEEKNIKMNELDKDLVQLCQTYKVPAEAGFDWFNIFKTFLFYNLIIPSVTLDLCRAVEYYSEDDNLDLYSEWRKIHEKNFPVGVMVSPYASERDIIDFVKKHYKNIIEPMQRKYIDKGVALGKTRRKNSKVQERDEFIYAHRHLPHKEIALLVSEKYPEKDFIYNDVGKTISRKRKKRKTGH